MKKTIVFAMLAVLVLCSAAFAGNEQIYSGLIVDARELGVEPSKSPKIYNEKGQEVYGTMSIDPDFVIETGIIHYTDTIYNAIVEDLAGSNPIVVRALGRGVHPFKADVLISVEDGAWISSANKKSHFLEKLKVVFVID